MTDEVYVAMVCSLFDSVVPTLIIGFSFALIGMSIVAETQDAVLIAFWGLGIIAAVARLIVMLVYRSDRTWEACDAVRAGRAERLYAFTYFAFAAALGAFTARSMLIASPDAKLLVVGLVFGYGAGVTAGVALRPWIGVPSMMIGILPMIIICLLSKEGQEFGLGLLTAAFLAGGTESLLRRYRRTVKLLAVERALNRLQAGDRPFVNW